MEKLKKFFKKLDICVHILLNSGDERFLQYLSNRIPRDIDAFYMEDEYLLHTLEKKDEELKWQK